MFPQGTLSEEFDPELWDQVSNLLDSTYNQHTASDAWRANSFRTHSVDPTNFDEMLRMWVGSRALAGPDRDQLQDFQDYFRGQSIWPNIKRALQLRSLSGLRVFELGTLHDLCNLFSCESDYLIDKQRRCRILEIGGGFGRLAEGAHRVVGQRAQIVLADAVPASLYWAKQYLQSRFPYSDVCLALPDIDRRRAMKADFLLVPPNRVYDLVPDGSIDIACSIASFQEMTQDQVYFWQEMIDKKLKIGGLAYYCHSRDYVFSRTYHYPPNWRRLAYEITPRAYSPDYPVEILRKDVSPSPIENQYLELKYLTEVMGRYRGGLAEVRQENLNIRAKFHSRVSGLREAANRKSALAKAKLVENAKARLTVRELQHKNHDLKARIAKLTALSQKLQSQKRVLSDRWLTLKVRRAAVRSKRAKDAANRSEAQEWH